MNFINSFLYGDSSGTRKIYSTGSIYLIFQGISNSSPLTNGISQFSYTTLYSSSFNGTNQVINSAVPDSSFDIKTGTGHVYNRIRCVNSTISGAKDINGGDTNLTISMGSNRGLYGYQDGPYNPGIIGYVYQYLSRGTDNPCPISMSGIENGLYDIYIYSFIDYNNINDPQYSKFTIFSGSATLSKSTSIPPNNLGNGFLPNFVENETYVKFSNFNVTDGKVNILWQYPDGVWVRYAPLNAIQLAKIDETFTSSVVTPTVTPSGSTYSTTQSVVLSSITSGSTIRYTLDGTTPTNYYGNIYSSNISIFNTTTLKAMAYKLGSVDSDVNTQIYIFPGSGSLNQVTLSLAGTFENQNVEDLYNIIDGNISSSWNPPIFNSPNLWTGFTNGIINYTYNGLVTPVSYSYDITLTNNRSLSLAFDHSDEGTDWTTFDSLNLNFSPSWTPRFDPKFWNGIASSADGTKLAAVVNGGQIYTSTNSGVSWTARETGSNRTWSDVASSDDGSKLVATDFGGKIYTSTNSGSSWTARETGSNRNWRAVASSADGTKLAAVVNGGQIYTSTNSGVSWTARETNRNWSGIASSADGTKLAAVVNGGQIYTSTDSGVSWTARETNRNWSDVASSDDGSKLTAVVNGGKIYTSIDNGITWSEQETNRNWIRIASSANGNKLAAVDFGGRIYTVDEGGGTSTGRKSGTYVLGSSITKKYIRIKMTASDNFPGAYSFNVYESKFI